MWGAAMDSAGTWSTNGKGCGFNKTCSPPSPLRGVCPTGWHLPTKAEFLTLFTAVGGMSVAGKKLKSTSGWKDYNEIIGNGTDDYSFSALPASNRDRGGTSGEGYNAYFWSSTEDRSDLAIGVNLRYINDNAFMDLYNKDFGLSVRCVKGEAVEQSVKSSSSSVVKSSSSSVKASSSSVAKSSSSQNTNSSSSSSSAKSSSSSATSSSSSVKSSSSSSATSSSSSVKSSSSSSAKSSSSSVKSSSSSSAKSSSSSVKSSSSCSATSSSSSAKSSSSSKDLKLLTDYRDGQTYKTVTIGWQTWMAENLNYETKNSFCYNDKPSNCTKYGRLYTWAAAMDSAGKWSVNAKGCGYLSNYICSPIKPVQGVCPVGWHLPSVQEWNTLLTSYQEASDAGKVLKSTSGWNSSGNGTDAFSFSALPAGIMWYSVVSGVYNYEGDYAYFWSSTEYGESHAYYMSLHYSNDGADLGNNNVFKHDAISVRCLKN